MTDENPDPGEKETGNNDKTPYRIKKNIEYKHQKQMQGGLKIGMVQRKVRSDRKEDHRYGSYAFKECRTKQMGKWESYNTQKFRRT